MKKDINLHSCEQVHTIKKGRVNPPLRSFNRKNSLRLKDYDYHLPGPYFVTICTDRKKNLFENSTIRDKIIEIIKSVGADLSAQIHNFTIDTDHIHGLLSLPEEKKVCLSKFVAIIKVRITQFLREGRVNPPLRVWQKGYKNNYYLN